MAGFKTNVMRFLDQKKISYHALEYEHGDDAVDGITAAKLMGLPQENVFKTLVTRGSKGGFYVFVIPVAKELDLKKAAKVSGEKSVEMLPVKDLLKVTGYIRGGCSPLCMKKLYPTVIDASAESLPEIVVSAGKIGYQVQLDPSMLNSLINGVFSDIVC